MACVRKETFIHYVGGHALECQVRYSFRRVRSIAVRFLGPKTLRVNAPGHYSRLAVEDFLSNRQTWLRRQLRRLQDHVSLWSGHYRHGSIHPFQGQPVYLHWQETAKQRISLRDGPPRLTALVPAALSADQQEAAVCRAMQRWYQRHALHLFSRRLQYWVERIDWLEKTPSWNIRRMRSRWGSCSSSNHITLNTHLIKVPPECLDYVIVHELCHLREMNHGPGFYRLQNAILPDWRQRKQALRCFHVPNH